MMKVEPVDGSSVLQVIPDRFADSRGYFSETYNKNTLAEVGIDLNFVQDNHSYSACRGTLRGLHYQLSPRAQAKLLRVVRGAIFDVAVDIRKSSPTFGRWVSLEVSAEAGNQILIPVGFAHGFVTLEDNTEVIYKVTDFYAAKQDRSIRFDDSEIGINWPFPSGEILLSEKDKNGALLNNADVFE